MFTVLSLLLNTCYMLLNIPFVFAHAAHGIFQVNLVFALGFFGIFRKRHITVRTIARDFPGKTADITKVHVKIPHNYHLLFCVIINNNVCFINCRFCLLSPPTSGVAPFGNFVKGLNYFIGLFLIFLYVDNKLYKLRISCAKWVSCDFGKTFTFPPPDAARWQNGQLATL